MSKGPFTRSDFTDPILGLKNWKQAFRRSDFKVPFVARMWEGHLQCVHTIRFSELTKNVQFGAKIITSWDIMQNLSALFIFQEESRMKIENVLFPSVFSKLLIPVSEGHFQCVHMTQFLEPTKIGSLKMDRANGPLRWLKIVNAARL